MQGAEADPRSDLFSFGCVLYEMLTGRRAFEGKSQLSVFTAILEKDPEPISSNQPLAAPMLDLVVRGCLVKDPAERTQSAHDIAMELRWITSLRTTLADAESSHTPARSRVPWFIAVAAAIVVGIVAGFLLHRSAPSTLSSSGGQVPQWGADGKELFYFDANQSLLAVPVKEADGALEFGVPQTIVKQWTILTLPFYSVSHDGKRVLMERVTQQVNLPVTVITNFTAGLRSN